MRLSCFVACVPNQADPLSLNSMNHNQQSSLGGHSDDYEALFANGVIPVRNRDRQRVIKNGARLRKSDAVLPLIRKVLSSIPLKNDSGHLPSSVANREPRRRLALHNDSFGLGSFRDLARRGPRLPHGPRRWRVKAQKQIGYIVKDRWRRRALAGNLGSFRKIGGCGNHHTGKAALTAVLIILPGKVRPASPRPEALENKAIRRRVSTELQAVNRSTWALRSGKSLGPGRSRAPVLRPLPADTGASGLELRSAKYRKRPEVT